MRMANVYRFGVASPSEEFNDRARRAGIPPHYCAASLDAFERTYGTAHALDRANELVRVSKPTRGLVLAGPTGVGKTHLAAGIALGRLAARCRARFCVVANLLNDAREYVVGRRERDPIAFV